MNPRIMRLNADYDRIRTEFVGHRYLSIDTVGATIPPERYVITYKIPGVKAITSSGEPIISNEHVAEIYLHAEYPRAKPKCTLRTQLFHPNFGSYICIGDHWAAGETLVDLIVQIGDMIQYKNYNPGSALNLMAAQWAVRNRGHFPIGHIDLLQPEPDIDMSGGGIDDDLGIVLGASPSSDDLDIRLL